MEKIAEWYLLKGTIPAWHGGEREDEKAAFPILQDWRIRGGNAECERRGGENRHQMLGQRTKKGEGEMERAMTSPGVYGQMPF